MILIKEKLYTSNQKIWIIKISISKKDTVGYKCNIIIDNKDISFCRDCSFQIFLASFLIIKKYLENSILFYDFDKQKPYLAKDFVGLMKLITANFIMKDKVFIKDILYTFHQEKLLVLINEPVKKNNCYCCKLVIEQRDYTIYGENEFQAVFLSLKFVEIILLSYCKSKSLFYDFRLKKPLLFEKDLSMK